MQNLSSENEFYLHENKSHFLNNGLALMKLHFETEAYNSEMA